MTMQKILLIDDDESMFYLVKVLLRNTHEVECYNNASAALAHAKGNSYDLMFMDINFGSGMSGIELFAEMRKLENHKNTPIVAVTAFAMLGDREEFLNIGFNEYLSKPFNKSQLLRTIEKTLSAKIL